MKNAYNGLRYVKQVCRSIALCVRRVLGKEAEVREGIKNEKAAEQDFEKIHNSNIDKSIGEVKTLYSGNAILCFDGLGKSRLLREREHPKEYSILLSSCQKG